jgi:hypothetical protein
MFEGLKKIGAKNKKIIPLFVALEGRDASPSAQRWHSGKVFFPKCGVWALSGKSFWKKRESLPRVLWAGTRGRN